MIVQDEELVAIFKMLHAAIDIPHPTTISRDVREMFTITREALGQYLQVRQLFWTVSTPYRLLTCSLA